MIQNISPLSGQVLKYQDNDEGLVVFAVMIIMHQDDLSRNNFSGSIDSLLELVAAFCLGEVEIQLQNQPAPHLIQ